MLSIRSRASALAVFLLIGSLLASCAAHAPEGSQLRVDDPERRTLVPGGIDILTFDYPVNPVVLIGNPRVIEVRAGGRPEQLSVIAHAIGASRIVVYKTNGDVARTMSFYVLDTDLNAMASAARQMLEGVEGVSVAVRELKIVIDGVLADTSAMDRIAQVKRAFDPEVVILVRIDPRFYEERARQMEAEIRREPSGQHVRVLYLNGTYLLVGHVESSGERERAEALVHALLPEMLGSPAIADSVLIAGTKKYSIRNLIEVTGSSAKIRP